MNEIYSYFSVKLQFKNNKWIEKPEDTEMVCVCVYGIIIHDLHLRIFTWTTTVRGIFSVIFFFSIHCTFYLFILGILLKKLFPKLLVLFFSHVCVWVLFWLLLSICIHITGDFIRIFIFLFLFLLFFFFSFLTGNFQNINTIWKKRLLNKMHALICIEKK